MKNRNTFLRGLMLLAVVTFTLCPVVRAGNCGQGNGRCGQGQKQGQGQCRQNGGGQAAQQCRGGKQGFRGGKAARTLTSDESAGLTFMLQEERLAHDVYDRMHDTWNLRIFDNIRSAETRHMAALDNLAESFDIESEDTGNAGEFANAELQALYDKLVKQGETSLVAALKAGALIEEVDILDLQEQLDTVSNSSLKQVYSNLQQASHNHLNAFVRQLERRNVTYEPQHLDADTYQAILDGGTSNCGGGKGQQQGRRQGRGRNPV